MHIHALRDRAVRDSRGLYVAEGLRFLNRALRHHTAIDRLIVAPSEASHLPWLRHHFAPIDEVATLRGLAHTENPQGVIAIVRQKWQPLDRVALDGKLCWIAVESIRSPGNLGTILRTAEAVGAAGLIVLGDADPYDPLVVRASMGAIAGLRLVRTTIDRLVPWAAVRRWRIVGTSPDAPHDYRAARDDAPTVLLLGSERAGVSPALLDRCTDVVRIPMVGPADSLNVAVAAGVLLYEVFHQRRHP